MTILNALLFPTQSLLSLTSSLTIRKPWGGFHSCHDDTSHFHFQPRLKCSGLSRYPGSLTIPDYQNHRWGKQASIQVNCFSSWYFYCHLCVPENVLPWSSARTSTQKHEHMRVHTCAPTEYIPIYHQKPGTLGLNFIFTIMLMTYNVKTHQLCTYYNKW